MSFFASARRALSAVLSVIGLAVSVDAQTSRQRYQGPPVPLLHPGLRIRYRKIPSPLHANGGKRPRVKGQRDRSLQSRSNRRKAAK
jgi:hypothetical protein